MRKRKREKEKGRKTKCERDGVTAAQRRVSMYLCIKNDYIFIIIRLLSTLKNVLRSLGKTLNRKRVEEMVPRMKEKMMRMKGIGVEREKRKMVNNKIMSTSTVTTTTNDYINFGPEKKKKHAREQ